jgi:hypothetical protein
MALALPDIPESERTPLVLLLLDIIQQQQEQAGSGCTAAAGGVDPEPCEGKARRGWRGRAGVTEGRRGASPNPAPAAPQRTRTLDQKIEATKNY